MKHRLCLSLAASLALASLAFGQMDEARIVGTITDASGAAVPGAEIVLTSNKTGVKRTVAANERGYYILTNLAPAQYGISASSKDLGPTEFNNIVLTAGQERVVDLVLRPASIQQEVTVSGGDLVVVDTSSARIGANVNEREVGTLPLNGRQLSQLYLLAPGAQTAGGGSYDNIRFSGRANQQNAIRFDGVEASSIIDASPGNLNGEVSTGFRLQSSLENVQEFRVESSNYPAEYGTGTAGQISVVTKSGSNEYHGAVFEYLRNSAMDARNFFDKTTSPSPLKLNQFGGSIGGPIQKNKLFFFASFEGLRQRAGVNVVEAVPSDAARAKAVAAVQPLLAAWPSGGTPTSDPNLNLYTLNAAQRLDENYGSIRLDYRISDKYSLTARYFRDQGELTQPMDVTNNFQRTTAVPQNALVSLQQVLTPNSINETKFGFNGQKTRLNGVAPTVSGIDLSQLYINFTGNSNISGIGGQGASAAGANLGGLIRANSAQNGRAQPYTNYTLTFADQFSWIHRNHTIKMGVELRPVRIYTDRLGGTSYSWSSIGDFLNNVPVSVSVLGDVSGINPLHPGITGNRFLKQTYYIGFVQDEWKLRPNLTMNYGLRYEYYSPLSEDRGLFTYFDMATGTLSTSNRQWYQSSTKNFGPRLAFTWAPTALNNNTVLRIGAGYYYGPGQTEDQVQTIDSDRASRTLTAAFPVDPAAVLAGFKVGTPGLKFQPRAYAPGYTLPEKVLSYTFSIQQQLPANTVLTVAYVGSQGRNLFLRSWTNLLLGISGQKADGTGIPVYQYGDAYNQIDYKTSGGTDHYDSLQTTVNRRFSRGLTVGAQWTYGHSIGNTGGSNEAQTQQNPLNFEQDRGNNAFDVRHTFNASALYELPFGKGRKYMSNSGRALDTVLGGWELGGVVNFRTGLPIDLTMVRNDIAYVDGNGIVLDGPYKDAAGVVQTTAVVNNPWGGAFRNNRRPSVVAGVSPLLTGADKTRYLNPAAFTVPAPGTYGNLGRWAIFGPSLGQLDLTLHKKFDLTEKINLEFRAEAYNLLNHANFANPSARLNGLVKPGKDPANPYNLAKMVQPGMPYAASTAGGTFGQITSTVTKDVGLGASRQFQMSLRMNF